MKGIEGLQNLLGGRGAIADAIGYTFEVADPDRLYHPVEGTIILQLLQS